MPLEGFSELLFTARLDYFWGNLGARIDDEMHYSISDRMRGFITATNLTDEPQVTYQGYPGFVKDISFSGRNTVGLRYDF